MNSHSVNMFVGSSDTLVSKYSGYWLFRDRAFVNAFFSFFFFFFLETNNQNIESVLRGKATEMSATYFEAKQPECQHCT